MPVNSSDQQVTTPVDGDTADAPVAFTDFLADVENRLVRRYVNDADRVARAPSPGENQLWGLATEDRFEVFDGTSPVSLWSRSFTEFRRRTADAAAINNSTTLVNDAVLALPVVINAVYVFGGVMFYDASATADAKFAFAFPGGSTTRWGIMGLGTPGTTDMTTATTNGSSTALPVGGNGVGTIVKATIDGILVTGGTAGNLQVQYAQNTLDATNFTVRMHSYLWLARVL